MLNVEWTSVRNPCQCFLLATARTVVIPVRVQDQHPSKAQLQISPKSDIVRVLACDVSFDVRLRLWMRQPLTAVSRVCRFGALKHPSPHTSLTSVAGGRWLASQECEASSARRQRSRSGLLRLRTNILCLTEDAIWNGKDVWILQMFSQGSGRQCRFPCHNRLGLAGRNGVV